MKMRFILYVLICFVLVACKQESGDAPSEEVQLTSSLGSPNEKDVEASIEALHKAMIDKDTVVLQRLCAEKLSYGHSSGLVQTKEEFVEDVLNGPFEFTEIKTEDQEIALIGEVAVVRHNFVAKGTNQGEEADVRIGNVQLYQRLVDGSWQLVLRQGYKL